MGCVLNKNVVSKKKSLAKSRRNTLVNKPTVKVAAGKGIDVTNGSFSKIIFIFGMLYFHIHISFYNVWLYLAMCAYIHFR